ncbi:leucyl aminopeptidase family protein [Sporosarcina limicola]|uniref:Probable cytosol aminopeptidase n=1 Tax=Sporosarcina limicola TaxID=34101 RepID=A0A927MQ93_9BACL|nr:leucyl aminopeptidase family protein [Sporosarcina limicola]MBE1555386.1 leucyl aminopeptidase [Sporosarcina limicola]
MTKQVKIIFASDSIVANNSAVKQFVDNQQADHTSVLVGDQHYVVVKECKDKVATLEKVRATAGNIARDLSTQKVETASVEDGTLVTAFANLNKSAVLTAFVEGWELGAYQFVTYKSDITAFKTELNVSGADQSSVEEGKIRAAAMSFSRDLSNEVPNVLNPETFPEVLKKNFEGTEVEVNVLDKETIEKMEMNGVLTVNRGSKYKPAFVELIYKGDDTKPLVALVGKGVTFDTGGISLKSGKDLSDMRMDMGGAAAVSGALTLLAKMKAKVNVVALMPIVENMPDSLSVLPGEVITYKNGLTVQVGNTDAEGRLILADALIRAGEWKAEYIVDIATLTGAVLNALGTEIGGVFGDEELSATMKRIGDQNGDFIWPMPLVEAYDKTLASDYADMNNISSLNVAGSITAGLFLRRFVPKDSKWLHVDMAGVVDKTAVAGYYGKSATGYGARLLADFTVHISK